MKFKLQYRARVIVDWWQINIWRRKTLLAIGFIFILSILIFYLSLIPNNTSQVELEYAVSTSDYSRIAENPLSLPHKLVSFVGTQLNPSVRTIRSISIIVFGLCVVALYRILKRWHSDKIALFGAAMFATNAVALAVGRLGDATVLLFGWSIIISLLLWIVHGNSRRLAPFMLLIIPAAEVF